MDCRISSISVAFISVKSGTNVNGRIDIGTNEANGEWVFEEDDEE